MQLDGLHHITMITADAPGTVAFYADTLGLRLVKQTVNFDRPEAYHLYFGDETGAPGSILTWFEFPGAAPGRAGAGMVHTIELAVDTPASLDFWARRLQRAGRTVTRRDDGLAFTDPDGLSLTLLAGDDAGPPLRARHPEVPAEHAIRGIRGTRAFAGSDLDADGDLLVATLGLERRGPGDYRSQGPTRGLDHRFDEISGPGVPGAGTVHHIALHSRDADHAAWRERVQAGGQRVTPVIDRDYFQSIYFRGPQGVLYEIATSSPGFAVDEDPDRLGEALCLPSQHEHLRAQLRSALTPLVNPRAARRRP